MQKGVPEGYVIQFIGDNGKVLKSVEGLSASYKIPHGLNYVRAKVILTVKENDSMRQYFAWGQPVFTAHHH